MLVLLVAGCVSVSVTSPPAQAQVAPGCSPIQYWLGNNHDHWFGGTFSSPYATGRIPTPPYFALHPPVYYSYPVPRSYGYSPFAYPGIVATPEVTEVSAPEPEEIINPHVKPSVKETSEKLQDRVTQNKSQWITNPYAANPGLKPGVELTKLLKQSR
jgi:hypothetical protein